MEFIPRGRFWSPSAVLASVWGKDFLNPCDKRFPGAIEQVKALLSGVTLPLKSGQSVSFIQCGWGIQ
jgi:hypothetical protein